ncbi:MAG: YcxB family protein [Oscillospiraceae bacterium]|nr:YcxB family protein [Oscillospiraceae bacterium]
MASFVFQFSGYDAGRLLPQLSLALEAGVEADSRNKHSALWKHIDHRRARSGPPARGKSLLFLAVGIFLLVPGLVRPGELLLCLLAGAASILAGVNGLYQKRRLKHRFDLSARRLLMGKEDIRREDGHTLSFSPAGMTLPDQELVPYKAFIRLIVSRDLFLLYFDERILPLKKEDLVLGNADDFLLFLKERLPEGGCIQLEDMP